MKEEKQPLNVAGSTSFIRPDAPFPKETTIWEVYCNEAKNVDDELVEDWKSSLNSLLIFASIFAAILTAFIIESKNLLQQDSTDVIANVLIFYTNNLANGTHTPYTPPSFEPAVIDVAVNGLFFTSLSLSLIAALAGVLALRWVSEYDLATKRIGVSPEDRAKRRHFYFRGTIQWKMESIVAALPVLLNFAVILFFAGLVAYMWRVHRGISSIILAGTGVAVVFYLLTTLLAVWFPSCPYRTPLSEWIYSLYHIVLSLLSKMFAPKSQEMGTIESPAKVAFPVRVLLSLRERFAQRNIKARDDIYVEDAADLKLDALAWVSRHISVSNAAYNRLRLLIREIPKYDFSSSTRSVSWKAIMDIIGVNFVSQATKSNLGVEEISTLNALCKSYDALSTSAIADDNIQQSARLPGDEEALPLRRIDTPASEDAAAGIPRMLTRNIHMETKPLIYVSGYLRRPETAPRPTDTHSLVTRRIAYLNVARLITRSSEKLERIWTRVTELTQEEEICDYLIGEMLPALGSRGHEDTQVQIDNLVSLIRLRRPASLEEPIDLYDPSSFMIPGYGANPVIQRPTPIIYRLRCTNWLEYALEHPQIHDILKALLEVHRVYPNLQLRWRFVATQEEELSALLAVEVAQKGMLSKIFASQREGDALVRHIHPLDKLVKKVRENKDESHKREKVQTIMELACRDFSMHDFPGSAKYEGHGPLNLSNVEDRSLRLILYVASHVPRLIWAAAVPDRDRPPSAFSSHVSEYACGDYPSINTATIWQLRAMLWREFDPDVTQALMKTALINVGQLKRFAEKFRQPVVGVDSGGDFLLAIIHSHYVYGWSHGSTSLWSNGELSDLIPGLLTYEEARSKGQEEVSPESVDYLATLCDDTKHSPMRLQRLLIALVQADLMIILDWRKPDVLKILIKHVNESLISRNGLTYWRYLGRLADGIAASRDTTLKGWCSTDDNNRVDDVPSISEQREFERECTNAVEYLIRQYTERMGASEEKVDEQELDKELKLWAGSKYTGADLKELINPYLSESLLHRLVDYE